MKDLITVATFTIKDMVKRKSFIISNIIILLIIVVLFNIPNIMNLINGENDTVEGTKLLIVDKDNIFEGTLENLNNMELGYDVQVSNEDVSFDKIKEKIENEELDEAVVVTNT